MRYFLTFLLGIFAFCGIAQEEKTTEKDTTTVRELDQVVVTAQYNPQSIKKSVHNVTVINKEQIKRQAANNLADLLNFNLNLTVIPNSQTGKSTISFFGLDSQYFNILIDNIPMVSDNGLGNNVDLTQINLDDIERIEIVEGAMGVEYGANAVSGVINIITKKSSDSKWSIISSIQEETVSDEYEWFDKGRHIQALTVNHNLNDNWFASVGFNRNNFAGFLNHRKGQHHFLNDSLRGYDWLPKSQITTNALINHNINNHRFFYKFEYFNEEINYYDTSVRANINVSEQTSNPSSTDRIYNTDRFYNHLNGSGNFESGIRYNVSLSYQQQKRKLNEFNYFILPQEKSNESNAVYQSSKVFFSKGSLSNLFKRDSFRAQLGYELTFQNGFDTEASGSITSLPKSEKLDNIAVFASSEIDMSEKFSLRPGLRYTYNSKFDSKATFALTARQILNNGYEVRANIGTSYRTPNFQELYYYFVDSNHDVQGNENLDPESGMSAFINVKKRTSFKNTQMENTLRVNFLDVKDKIELAIVNNAPLQYQYINVDAYKLWGITNTNSFISRNWNFSLGATLLGVSRDLASEGINDNEFQYNLQVNSSATYNIDKWNTAISLLLKYNGKQTEFVATDINDLGNSTYTKIETDSYTWLDTSIKKSFFDDKFETTFGARNLFDVTRVNSNYAGGDNTHNLGNSFLLGYGRSYYLKLLYKLNF